MKVLWMVVCGYAWVMYDLSLCFSLYVYRLFCCESVFEGVGKVKMQKEIINASY
jgi:hypothetical protein